MILLGLDTSTPLASVALQVGDHIFERAEKVTTYSERLLVLVDEVLKEAGVSMRDVHGIAVGAGPGSFTGLRIGLSTAKGLCLGTGANLVMISSLEVLAARARGRVVGAVDAFRGEIYVGLFDVDDHVRARSPELAAFTVKPEALPALLAQHGGVDCFVGDGFVKYPVAIPVGATDTDGGAAVGPRGRELLHLASARFAANQVDDPRIASPSYVRASAPEEAKAEKKP